MNIPLNQNVVSLATNIPDEYKHKFLKSALVAWQSPMKNCHHIVENISKEVGISKGKTYEIIGVYITIIKLFLQNSHNDFVNRLTDMGFSSQFISDLALVENENELIRNLRKHSVNNFCKLSIVKWKIDLNLFIGLNVKTITKPVILCITLNNGNKYTISVEAKMFHKLRFSIAMMLREINAAKSYSNKALQR